jgi:hypothetical protein
MVPAVARYRAKSTHSNQAEAVMRVGVPVPSVVIRVTAGLIAVAAGAQQLSSACEGGPGGSASTQESPGRAELRFDPARQGADGFGGEQLAAALPGADRLRQQFMQADEDGDGRISREEWLRWFGLAHAEAADGQPSWPN